MTPIRDLLAATVIFVNAAKGISALQLGRDLDMQYRTAFVLAHKLREALAAEQAETALTSTVEAEGAYFGGHVKPENEAANRKDQCLAENQTGKHQVVVVARERGEGGKTLPFVVKQEADAVKLLRKRIATASIVHTNTAAAGTCSMRSTIPGASTTVLRSRSTALARTRRKATFRGYDVRSWGSITISAGSTSWPMPWREETRRQVDRALHQAAMAAALGRPVSRIWKGYWQRTVIH